MIKVAIDAGHGIMTSGKRCLKKFDKNETREWFLNNRVACYVEKILKEYKDVSTIRTDDTSGKVDISLNTRCKTANNRNVDAIISFHHNAGGGNGLETFIYKNIKNDSETYTFAKIIHDSIILSTKQKNRGIKKADFAILRDTHMKACLIEFGFMDNKQDTPIILSDDFAKKAAIGVANGIVDYYKLERKEIAKPNTKNPQGNAFLVKITDGSLNVRENADANSKKTGCIKDKGIYTIIDTTKAKDGGEWGKLKSGKGWINLFYTKKV